MSSKEPAPKGGTAANKGATAVKKPGRVAQIRQVYTASKAIDPRIGWWMLLAFISVLLVALVVGLALKATVYALIVGLPLALLAATLVMSRRAERAAYQRIAGQSGAAGAALSALRRGWYVEEQPVAAEATRPGDPASAAMVFRAVGRPGVVLVAEGPTGRAQKLLAAERKRTERVAPGVPVTTLRIGDGGGDDVVPIRKLGNKVQRMKPVLTKDEVSVVNKRLRALGGVRPPLPQGVDPTRVRVDRKALRGR